MPMEKRGTREHGRNFLQLYFTVRRQARRDPRHRQREGEVKGVEEKLVWALIGFTLSLFISQISMSKRLDKLESIKSQSVEKDK